MTAFILPQRSNGHSLDKVEHRARLPPSQNESSELRFRRSSLADQLLCDGTHLSLVYGASCRRKAKGLSVAPLSTFYRKYRRLPPLLGHFSDRSGRRTRPKPMTNEVSPASGRLLAAFTAPAPRTETRDSVSSVISNCPSRGTRRLAARNRSETLNACEFGRFQWVRLLTENTTSSRYP